MYYKGGARDDCTKYGPISVLPALARAFEKLVCNQLYYLTEDSKTRQYRIPPLLFVNRTLPAGFPEPCIIRYKYSGPRILSFGNKSLKQ